MKLPTAVIRDSLVPEAATRALTGLAEASRELEAELRICSPEFLVRLGDLLSVSPPMLADLGTHPQWLKRLHRRAEAGFPPEEALSEALEEGGPRSTEQKLELLRALHRRSLMEIAWRDVAGLSPFEEVVAALSGLADATIGAALDLCWRTVADAMPGNPAARALPAGFAVLALGKLGGRELNYSSDIDLIFCRRDSKDEDELRFYTRLGERLVRDLSHAGKEGFLYRVDMRLRPYGSGGPLVPTIGSLINYYESWAEAWERQALIKWRAVAGDADLIRRFGAFVSGYTFARQMDDSSLEEIKRVKWRSEKAYAPEPGRIHIKQGPGGIRDIEFYVQYLQLTSGSLHPEVRSPSTLGAIAGLKNAKATLEGEATELSLAYVFLRTVEHRLQLRSLTPEAVLTENSGEADLLARTLGFAEAASPAGALLETLESHRRRVRRILERIYLAPGALRPVGYEELAQLLSERTPKERAGRILSRYGFRDFEKAWRNIRLMALGPAGRLLPPGERRAFLEIVFPMLEVLRDSLDPDRALDRLEGFASATGNRVSFLRTLASRRPHLTRLVNLLALSNYGYQILCRHPEYFDTLASGMYLDEGRSLEEMAKELGERLDAAPAGDAAGEVLRRFRQRETVRIAYRDLARLADPIEISAELSSLAEACVVRAMDLARRSIPGDEVLPPLTIVGLGKLGSRQMHYSSDLDLLFFYRDLPAGAGAGEREAVQRGLDGRVEKLLELLAGVTREGIAYRVDLRLRPEGSSGLLARSREGILDYSRRYMQPWERMALVRSRALGEDAATAAEWRLLVKEIVYRYPWDEEALEAVRNLKGRIEREKNRESRTHLDFKYGRGGIADLEFLVQFLQVQYGRENPAVRTPAIAPAVAALRSAGALTDEDAEIVLSGHRFLRRVENHYQVMEEWPALEVSRSSPDLQPLARSLGFSRAEFLGRWDRTAASVREIVEKRFWRRS